MPAVGARPRSAAAAACCVAGLDAQQIRWALGYTAHQSSGTRAWQRDTGHIEKGFVFAGMPARNGVTSALLVKAGWDGVDDIFTGADNFFATYAPKAEPERLVDKLGERFDIALTDIKKWTVGSPIQAPLDGIETIRGKHPFEADQVRRVTVRVAPPVAGRLRRVRIGRGAMIGALTMVTADVLPFALVSGPRGHLDGLNLVGLNYPIY